MAVINSFDGDYRWLSNFYPADVILDGTVFPSVEHAYQAAKTANHDHRLKFLAVTAGQAKRLGKTMALRAGWDDLRVPIMRSLLIQKFFTVEMAHKLMATEPDMLVEGNTWGDTYWGICKGQGNNRLGLLLMEVRSMLLDISGR